MTDPLLILGVGILLGLVFGFLFAWSFVYRMVERALDKGVPVKVRMDPEQQAEWRQIRSKWEAAQAQLMLLERDLAEDDTVLDLKLDELQL